MAGRKEDVDLELVLQVPDCARQWVSAFDWDGFACPPQYMVYGVDGKVYLDQITDKERVTDDQAVMAALLILRGYEIPAVMKERDYLRQVCPEQAEL